MKIFNKEISFADFLPYILLRIWRRYLVKAPEWKSWENSAVPVLLYYGPFFKSFSQFGEDIILSDIFRHKEGHGRFIDIGANHPKNLNNTYRLYTEGWRGVNVEPGLKMFNELLTYRPEDINLQIGIGKMAGKAIFYEMDVDSVSTFNQKEAVNGQYQKNIVSKNEVEIRTLKNIFEEYFDGILVDLVSIDVEGNNFEVLEGNDWGKYRPSFILIEMPGEERVDIIPYLYRHGYYLIFDNSLNGIFADSGVKNFESDTLDLKQCLTPQKLNMPVNVE